jgi:hypothetical protein
MMPPVADRGWLASGSFQGGRRRRRGSVGPLVEGGEVMTGLAIVAVLVVLVVLGVLIVAALVASLRFPAGAQAFRCKLRPLTSTGRTRPWPRRRCRAVWVHDVLLVRRGVLPARLQALAVRTPEDPPRETTPTEVRGLGGGPVAVVLRLDDGTLLEVAAPWPSRTHLVGPFLAAAAAAADRLRGPRGQRNIEH